MAEQSSRSKKEADLIEKAVEDEAFRQEFIANPKDVLQRELGKQLPESVNVKVLQEDGDNLYIVIPGAPPSGLSSDQLAGVAGGRTLPDKTVPDNLSRKQWEKGRRPQTRCLDDFWFI